MSELIYEYTPKDISYPGIISFDVQQDEIRLDCMITETAELDFAALQQIGHFARPLPRHAKQGNLPADCVLPLPTGSVFNTLGCKTSEH